MVSCFAYLDAVLGGEAMIDGGEARPENRRKVFQHMNGIMLDNNHSLYDRLGGVYHIAAIVDDLVERLMDNPALNANAAIDEAHHRLPKAGFKYLVTEMVCWAASGPQKYTGKNMRESHEHLAITEDEWQVFLIDLRSSLDRFMVPAGEQGELFAIVANTKGDMVLR